MARKVGMGKKMRKGSEKKSEKRARKAKNEGEEGKEGREEEGKEEAVADSSTMKTPAVGQTMGQTIRASPEGPPASLLFVVPDPSMFQ